MPVRDPRRPPADGSGGGARGGGGGRSLWVVVPAVLALAWTFRSLHGLDGAVRRLSDPTGVRGGPVAVASPGTLLDPGRGVAITTGWSREADAIGALVGRFTVLDAAFAAGLSALLGWLVRGVAGGPGARAGTAAGRRARAARAAVLVYLAADLSETVTLLAVWSRPSTLSMRVVGALSAAKWLSLGAALLALAGAVLPGAGGRRTPVADPVRR